MEMERGGSDVVLLLWELELLLASWVRRRSWDAVAISNLHVEIDGEFVRTVVRKEHLKV